MSKLITLNSEQDKQVLSEIFENEIIVFEDIQGSKIWVSHNGKFNIKPKSISNQDINLVDLAMQNYYNPAINYFDSLSDRVISLMPKNWWFCFEYFPDNQPANIEYQKMPKNGLVLTAIYKNGKYTYTYEELCEYARLFEVDVIPVIFQGNLSDSMKEAITYFLNTSEDDLEYVFGEKSFSFFFYKILNPNTTASFLMEDDFQKNLQKIIIRIKSKDISFEILNPLYNRLKDDNLTSFTDVYTLILVNFLNFCQSVNLEEIKLKGNRKDECYIYLICKLFNIYINDVKDDIYNFDFTVPEFFDKEKFKINRELIPNKLTKEFIDDNQKFEYIFKIILGSFNKKRNKAIGVFNDSTVNLFNMFVEKIDTIIDRYLRKLREVNLRKDNLLDFNDFFDIKYDTDAEGQVYIQNFYDEIEKRSDKKKSVEPIKSDKK